MGLSMLATGLYFTNTTVGQQQAEPGHSGNTTLDTMTGEPGSGLVPQKVSSEGS